MSLFGWGSSSKPSKAEGIPFDEIKWLQKSLQQGLEILGLLESSSEALKAAVVSQTYTAQKLQQELRSCNHKNVLIDKETQTEETKDSEETGFSGDCSFDRLADANHPSRDMYHGKTESAVDPPSQQQEIPDDILDKLLLNNQTVLIHQATANQKAVQSSTHWLQNLQQQVDSWFSQNFELTLNEQESKYKALEEEKNQLSKNCKDIEKEKNKLIEKCKGLEAEKNQLSEKCKKLEEASNKLSAKCKDFEEAKKEIEKLKKDCDRLSTENSQYKTQAMATSSSGRPWYYPYSTVPQNKPVTTQVYCPRKSDLTTNVVSELSRILQVQMSSYHLDLVIQMCDTPSSINRALPVIVICLNASRLGTDVTNALQGVQTNSNVVVLVLHHKDIHALPTQSSDRVLTGSEYKNVGAIIDMAFLTNKGMYTCDMNNRALENLKDFIQARSHS